MLVGVRSHAANAHKTVRNCGGEHRVCVYALAHQLPEKFAHQHFVVNNNRDYRCEAIKQLESESQKLSPQRITQLAQAMTTFRLALDYLYGFEYRSGIRRRQRRRI